MEGAPRSDRRKPTAEKEKLLRAAMTAAGDELHLCYAATAHDRQGGFLRPSHLIKELPADAGKEVVAVYDL
jgi:superfamily I DNA/RNA helicase